MKKRTFKTIAGFVMMATTLLFIQCKKSDATAVTVPTVTTNSVATSPTSPFTATGGGNVTSAGNATLTAYGVCYSNTNPNPDLTCPTTYDGAGAASGFISNLTGLSPSTVYFARAYATNSAGTGYGSVVQFTTSVTNWKTAYFTGNPISPIATLVDVAFADNNTGLAYGVDINRKIYTVKTTDGGNTWITSASYVNTAGVSYGDAYLPLRNKSIHIDLSGNIAIAYGGDSILTSGNGGSGWGLVPCNNGSSIPGEGINSLTYTNYTTTAMGYATGRGLFREQSGSAWASLGNTNTYFNSVFFTDANTGYAGSTAGIFKTYDAGNTWSSLTSVPSIAFYGISFCNGVLYACSNINLYISTDQGATWATRACPGGMAMNNVYFVTQYYGVAATQGGLYETYDGGNTWVLVNNPLNVGAFSNICVTGNHIYAVTSTGILAL